jgi:hypothetical protein
VLQLQSYVRPNVSSLSRPPHDYRFCIWLSILNLISDVGQSSQQKNADTKRTLRPRADANLNAHPLLSGVTCALLIPIPSGKVL